jgi:hypothetical protein
LPPTKALSKPTWLGAVVTTVGKQNEVGLVFWACPNHGKTIKMRRMGIFIKRIDH